MTPERKKELETIMDDVIKREIAAYSSSTSTPEQLSQKITDLCQIWVCIGTAFELLSGRAYERLSKTIVAAELRGPKVDHEAEGREAAEAVRIERPSERAMRLATEDMRKQDAAKKGGGK